MGKPIKSRRKRREKYLHVRSIRQDPPNVDRLTKTLLDMALRQAAEEQEAQTQRTQIERESRMEESHD